MGFSFYDAHTTCFHHTHPRLSPCDYPTATSNLLEGETVVSSCQTYLSTTVTASVGYCGQDWGPRTWIPENQPLLRWPIRACLAPTHQQCKAVQPSSVDELKPPSFLIFSFQLWQIKENLSGLKGRNYGANCFDFIPFGVLKEKGILNNDSWSHPAHQDNRQWIQYRHKHLSYRNQSTHPSLQHWKECTHSLIHSFLGKRILCRQKSGNLIMRFCVLNHISACKLSEMNALDCHQPLEW